MKLQFKLNKEESQAFKNFMTQTRPNEISEDDFIKGIFTLGMQTLEAQIVQKIESELKEKAQEEASKSDKEIGESVNIIE